MNGERSVFRLVCGLAALAALVLIGSNVAVILVRGAKSLPEALTQPETLFALATSLQTASLSTALCFVLAVPAAYLLTRTEFPGRGAVEVLLELTLSLPYIVLGVSLLILFSSPVGKALKAAGQTGNWNTWRACWARGRHGAFSPSCCPCAATAWPGRWCWSGPGRWGSSAQPSCWWG